MKTLSNLIKRCYYPRALFVIIFITVSVPKIAANLSVNNQEYRNIMDFIYANISYPTEAIEKGAEGLVTVSFQIENGKLSDLKLIKEQDTALNSEVMRLFSSIPQSLIDKESEKKVSEYSVLFRLNISMDSKEYFVSSVPDNTFVLTYLEKPNRENTAYGSPYMVVVNGKISPNSILSKIKPDEITSFNIIKSAAAEMNKEATNNGVVFVNLKDYEPLNIDISQLKNLPKKEQPIFVVDNIKTDASSVNPDEIESQFMVDGKVGKKLYDNGGENGVVFIKSTKNVRYRTMVPPRDPNKIIYIR